MVVLNHIYPGILHTVVVLKSYLHRYSSYCGSVTIYLHRYSSYCGSVTIYLRRYSSYCGSVSTFHLILWYPIHVRQYSNHIWLCLSHPYKFYYSSCLWVSQVNLTLLTMVLCVTDKLFFRLSVSFTQENELDNCISMQAISSMLLHKQRTNSLLFWHIYSVFRAHIHFGHNFKFILLFVKASPHLLKHPMVSTICCFDLWDW